MTDSKLPPIKGVAPRNTGGNDGNADISSTREISQSALESDRALIKADGRKKVSSMDIENGKIQKNSKKVTPASENEVKNSKKISREEREENRKEGSAFSTLKIAAAVAFLIIIAGIIALITMDMRSSDALIEKPMIAIYNTFPNDKTL
jgi:hypothetical protein